MTAKKAGIDFAELLQLVHGLPSTWYPSLLLEVARAAAQAGTWIEGDPYASSQFIREWEQSTVNAKALVHERGPESKR